MNLDNVLVTRKIEIFKSKSKDKNTTTSNEGKNEDFNQISKDKNQVTSSTSFIGIRSLHSWVKDTQTGLLLSLMGIASCVINMDIE